MTKHSSDRANLRARLLLGTAGVQLGAIAFIGVVAGAVPAVADGLHSLYSNNSHSATSRDQNGIDLGTGQYSPPSVVVSIGTADSGMTGTMGGIDFPNNTSYVGGITTDDPFQSEVWARGFDRTCWHPYVHFGSYGKSFTFVPPPTGVIGGHFVADDGSADILDAGPDANDGYLCRGAMTLTGSDGTVYTFDGSLASDFGIDARHGVLTSVVKPDGEVITIAYNETLSPTGVDDPDSFPGAPPEYFVSSYVERVVSSLGWRLTGGGISSGYGFYNGSVLQTPDLGGTTYAQPTSWGAQTVQYPTPGNSGYYVSKQRGPKRFYSLGANGNYTFDQYIELRQGFNQGIQPPFQSAAVQADRYNANVISEAFIDSDWGQTHQQWSYTLVEKAEITSDTGVKTTVLYTTPPDDFSKPNTTWGGCHSVWNIAITCVKSVTRGGNTWKYTWSNGNWTVSTVDIEDPLGKHRIVDALFTREKGTLITRYQDELNRVTLYEYDPMHLQPTKITYPEGNYEQFVYNARGNLTELRSYPKGGGTAIVQMAGYDTTCTNLKTCNKPNWTKDAKGNQTDYTYSSVHGGVLTVTLPAATDPVNGQQVRPQTRYTYAQLTPKVLNAGGVLVNSTPVWRVVAESTCRTATAANPAACVGTVNETVKEYAYVSNNLFRTSETVRAGNANVTVASSSTNLWGTTSYTYDTLGNVTVVDGPRTDVDDTSYRTYDIMRRPVFEIGIDPDGTGALKRAIVKHYYDADGREYRTEQGTGNTTNGSDFTMTTYSLTTYDPITGLPVKTIAAKP